MANMARRKTGIGSMYTVKRVWLDRTEELQQGSVDVLAEMEDNSLWMARFVTIPYLQEQMDYGLQVSESLENTPRARYATIETRHVIVDRLNVDTIENVIDNLLSLDVFESMFAPVASDQASQLLAFSTAIN
jgi:hypothetical protein